MTTPIETSRAALLLIWPDGAQCSHAHAREAFAALDAASAELSEAIERAERAERERDEARRYGEDMWAKHKLLEMRVKELEPEVERLNMIWRQYQVRERGWMDQEAKLITQREALAKRVAELEAAFSDNIRLGANVVEAVGDSLQEEIAELRAQIDNATSPEGVCAALERYNQVPWNPGEHNVGHMIHAMRCAIKAAFRAQRIECI